MPARRFRKRRARSLYAASRLVLVVAVIVGLFVATTVAGKWLGLGGNTGSRGMEPAQYAGLAIVAALAAAALVGMAQAHSIEYPRVQVIRPTDVYGQYADGRPAYGPTGRPAVPSPRRDVVEPTEIIARHDLYATERRYGE